MSTPIRLINLGQASFWQTQAVYHAVAGLLSAHSPDTIILTSPRTPYLCLGYHDCFDNVLDRDAVARQGLPVMRRRVGGGTTYLDAEQIFYQCVFHHRRVPALFSAVYAEMLAAPLAVLSELGLAGELRDSVELEVGGRRVAGIGGGRIGEAAVVVGNLLLDFDYAAMAGVWRAPWPGFRTLAAAALAERVTTLRELGASLSVSELAQLLSQAYSTALGRPLLPGRLTPAEVNYARRLGARMLGADYVARGELLGRAARPLKVAGGIYIHAVEAVFDGRNICVSLRVHGETIVAACVEPLSGINGALLEDLLIGQPLAQWQAALRAIPAA